MAQFNGKGSKPRPLSVSRKVRDANHETIFSSEEKEKLAEQKLKEKAEYFAKLEAETKARLEEAGKKKGSILDAYNDERLVSIFDKQQLAKK